MSRAVRAILGLSAAAAVAGAITIFTIGSLWPNKVVIRNNGSAHLQNVRIVLRHLDGRLVLCESAPTLAPGEAISFWHSANDLRPDLRFSLAGQVHSYQEPYIDLWRGERWMYTIDSNGGISSGYEGVGPN
jgi:hypothetical protein